jgi:hypothetical protein
MATKFQSTVDVTLSSFAVFKAWAGDITAALGTGTGISAALQTLGFTRNVGGSGTGGLDKYQAIWDNGTTVGAAALPTSAGSLGISGTPAQFPAITSMAGLQLAGTHFKGQIVNSTLYSLGDVVIDTTTAKMTFLCTTSLTTGAPYTAPNADATHWSPYWMEIWKMAATGLTDIYIKFEYGCTATAVRPQISFQMGTGYVVDAGVLSGNVTPREVFTFGSAGSTALECDFFGDGQNVFGMILARGSTLAPFPFILLFERSISGQVSNAPVYTSTYVSYFKGSADSAIVTNSWWSGALFTTGAVQSATRNNAFATISVPTFASETQITNGLTPAFPIFPMVGFVGNPMTAGICMVAIDTVEGALVQVTVYGALHTYMTTKVTLVLQIGNGSNSSLGVNIGWAFGLRFE